MRPYRSNGSSERQEIFGGSKVGVEPPSDRAGLLGRQAHDVVNAQI